MRRLLLLAAVSALAVARPELYKEQENFQYSRSSSDDGTKSGFYGAQRGNMGGNFERAHNMDSLAQNQMSGLVRQVDGELGSAANTRTGSVYSSANSRGIYGSGHYDLSNLAGRNFQESASYDNAQAHSSLAQSSSAHNSASYANSRSQSYGGAGYGGYQAASDAQLQQAENLQSLDNSQSNKRIYYGRQASSHSSGYQSQSGYQDHSEYDSRHANSQSGAGASNLQTRLVSATPVRIIIAPGGRIAVPVAAQVYDDTRASSVYSQNSLNRESEVASDNNQAVYSSSNPKHYESSYRYHKSWEKHDTVPTILPAPTPSVGSIPKNSELFEDAGVSSNVYQARGVDSQSLHSNSASGRYNAASSQSGYQANYNSQQHADSTNSNAYSQTGYAAGSHHGISADTLNAYTQAQYNLASRQNVGANADLNSEVENVNSKPKSYQSSYSYHKSWERQGDPYVIKPASTGYYDGQSSQRLSSSTKNGYAAYHSGGGNCDVNCHIRVARSYNTDSEDMQQQSQNIYDGEEVGQQVQSSWQNLGQESQSNWDQNVAQESQNNLENLEDLGQQAQSISENKWNNLEDFGQQSQSNFDQQNAGQESQNQWGNFAEDQQSQSNFEQQSAGQQSQNTWDQAADLNQQQSTNNQWSQSEDAGQQSLSQNTWDQFEDNNQQKENKNDNLEDLGQQAQNSLDDHKPVSESQLGYKPQDDRQLSQNEQRGDDVKPDKPEYSDNHPSKVESPWDKFDSIESSTNRVLPLDVSSKNGSTADSNEFYWHQITGGTNQYTSNTYNNVDFTQQQSDNQNSNTFFDNNPVWEQSSYNPGQSNRNVGFDSKDPSPHYSYSSDFVNPSIYTNQNQYSSFQNTYHQTSYDSQHLNSETHSNNHSYVSWQSQTTNTQTNNSHSNSHDTALSSFWNKFDTIEQQSGFSKPKDDMNTFLDEYLNSEHKIQDHTYQTESNFTSMLSNQSTQASTISTGREYQNQPQGESQLPQSFQPTNKTNVPQDLQNSSEEVERPEDVGRGDIGPEDISSKIYTTAKPNKLHSSSENKVSTINDKAIQQVISNNNVGVNSLSDSQQKEAEQILNSNKTTSTQNNHESQTNYSEFSETQNHHNIENVEEVSQHNYNIEQSNRDQESIHLEQQNFNSFDQENLQNFGQQNENLNQQNLVNFGQQNVQDFGQQNEDLSQQTSNTFEQENQHDFGQQNENLSQQTSDNFEQENQHDFGQQNEHFNQQTSNNFVQENQHEFGQQNENSNQQTSNNFEQEDQHDFGQQNENLNQQTSNNFEQENQYDFGQQNENLSQQTSNNFEQENQHDFGQKNENLNQQTSNNFEQENQHDFGQQNKDLGQQSSHNFGQENVEIFEQQNENQLQQNPENIGQGPEFHVEQQNENQNQQSVSDINSPEHNQHQVEQVPDFGQQNEQQSYSNFGQESEQDLGRQNSQMEQTQNLQDFGQQSAQEFELQRGSNEQQNYRNFEQESESVPLSQSEKVNTQGYSQNNLQPPAEPEIVEQKHHSNLQSNVPTSTEQSKVETILEPTSEKPGFWKSVGNKFSSAKDKVVSWFRS